MGEREKGRQISELGKYGLIDHLTAKFRSVNSSTLLAFGDDSAIIDNSGMDSLVSSDMLIEGIHFNLIYTPLKHLGYKTVIRGISDIYAMNGIPGQVIISLGISSRFLVEDLEEFYEGVFLGCDRFGVDLAGGDISSSVTGLAIAVTAIGRAESGKTVRRSGARPNDLICVTGDLGAAYMGLQLLERERKIFENDRNFQPELRGHEYIIGRQLKPEFPYKIPSRLSEENILPTSMIDITEGLASDLLQICKSSGTGCRIFRERIPVDSETAKMAEEFGIDPMIPALNGGEDFELLFTVPLEDLEKAKGIENVTIIGHMTQQEHGKYLVTADGSEIELAAQGWKQ